MCADCGLKTSATAGTMFHRSHTPLSTWFAAIWFVTSQKNGVSARGLQDALGFASYETAWAWLHKLRRAMVRPERELLSGVVELDQSFLGGRSHGKLGGSTEKAPITIAVERLASGRLGRARLQLADMPNGLDQVEFARQVIAPGAEIHFAAHENLVGEAASGDETVNEAYDGLGATWELWSHAYSREQARLVDLHARLGDEVLDELLLGQGAAERLAVVGALAHQLKGALR